jgi:hypothetical protein
MIITSEKELKRIVSEAVVEALALQAKAHPAPAPDAVSPHKAKAASLIDRLSSPRLTPPSSPMAQPQQ